MDIKTYLQNFSLNPNQTLFETRSDFKTHVEWLDAERSAPQQNKVGCYPKYSNEFWTSKQRQASSLHEIAYRACFKAQLPRFFINLLTKENDYVYDPFSGRGTTAIEAALLGRNCIANDINPLSRILTEPRIRVPEFLNLKKRLQDIPFNEKAKAEIDLSMFYHPKTETEIVSLKQYLQQRKDGSAEDRLDAWIRMVATNRLTGHSGGFFSVYTLPPNQAVSPESQKKINEKRNQKPSYRNTKELILKKSQSLLRNISTEKKELLLQAGNKALFLTNDARQTKEIALETVQLTVTSPPFLDVVQYADDNWLRCWFNGIDAGAVTGRITMAKTLAEWSIVMTEVFQELFRITKSGGWVAFEVGEIRGGKIKLEEYVVPLGIQAGFMCEAIVINQQTFTKTSNIWGIKNNERGTNSNRIVLLRKA